MLILKECTITNNAVTLISCLLRASCSVDFRRIRTFALPLVTILDARMALLSSSPHPIPIRSCLAPLGCLFKQSPLDPSANSCQSSTILGCHCFYCYIYLTRARLNLSILTRELTSIPRALICVNARHKWALFIAASMSTTNVVFHHLRHRLVRASSTKSYLRASHIITHSITQWYRV